MIEDLYAFSELLIRNRGNTTAKQRAEIIKVGISSIALWEGLRDIISLPKEEKLPEICRAYNIDLEEATKAWKLSKEAQACVVKSKKDKPTRRSSSGTGLSGGIASRGSLVRTNSQLNFFRYGRS